MLRNLNEQKLIGRMIIRTERSGEEDARRMEEWSIGIESGMMR
jgi:hypothetical protein